jgi:hypothetical protein
MRALLAHADTDEYRALFALMLAGGLRIGGALGLLVCDLDPSHSAVGVECQLRRDGARTPLKTSKSHRAVDRPVLMLNANTLQRWRGVPRPADRIVRGCHSGRTSNCFGDVRFDGSVLRRRG